MPESESHQFHLRAELYPENTTDPENTTEAYLCRFCGNDHHPYREPDRDRDRYSINRDRNGSNNTDYCRLCLVRLRLVEDEEYDQAIEDDDPCDCGFCNGRRRSGENAIIHAYNYRPRFQFRGTGPRFLGMELELETPGYEDSETGRCDVAERVMERVGDMAYLKEDGSINCGFEIVTHPMSFDYFMEHFPWPLFPELREMGCTTSADNGIHVHVSRAAFSSHSHTYRWLKLWYRSEHQVKRIARRASHWAAFRDGQRKLVKFTAKGWPDRRSLSDHDRREIRSRGIDLFLDRYSAVNVTNRDTFEVRVFRSSLDRRKIKAALALVDSTVEYTRQITAADICQRAAWEWSTFVDWVAEQPQYEQLTREMEVCL